MSYIDLHAHVLPGVDDGAWHESFSRHAARGVGDEDAVFGKI